jgi:hypothetical protein
MANYDASFEQTPKPVRPAVPAALPAREMSPAVGSVLTSWCAVGDTRPTTFVSKFHASCVPDISVSEYFERVIECAECSDACVVLSAIYLDRIRRHRDLVFCTLNAHRLIITSVMLAAKFFDDVYFNNAFYARIGGVSRREINGLELEFLFMVGFNLGVSENEYRRYDQQLRAHAQTMRQLELGCVALPAFSDCFAAQQISRPVVVAAAPFVVAVAAPPSMAPAVVAATAVAARMDCSPDMASNSSGAGSKSGAASPASGMDMGADTPLGSRAVAQPVAFSASREVLLMSS